jgi:tripartite-type tricarboxylate transporter receptor subunit TctC
MTKAFERLALAGCALLASLAVAQPQAHAQAFPTKPVRLIVPYPPGGPVDAVGRIVATPLSAQLGQNVIVENRSGAGGSLGAGVVAKSAPDGYTLLLGNAGPISVNPVLFRSLPYDSRKDLAPVSFLTTSMMVMVVHPSMPVRSVNDLVALARAHPGEINFGSAGIGNLTHLGLEMLQAVAKVKMNHVPYKGVAPAFVDLMSGQIGVMFGNITGPLEHIRAGRLRLVAVCTLKRSPMFPEVPTIAETYPGFELLTWMGVFAPAGTPEAIRSRLHSALTASLQRKEISERLVGLGNNVIAGSAADLAAHVEKEITVYGQIVRSAKIPLQ